MNAFLEKAKHINTIEEAEVFLWEQIPTPQENTKKALELSHKAHEGQFRKSGEPYVVHPILVAAITAASASTPPVATGWSLVMVLPWATRSSFTVVRLRITV